MRTRTLFGAMALSLLLMTVPAGAEEREGVPIGTEAPDVVAGDFINTEPVKLSQLKGRLVLLELFTTT